MLHYGGHIETRAVLLAAAATGDGLEAPAEAIAAKFDRWAVDSPRRLAEARASRISLADDAAEMVRALVAGAAHLDDICAAIDRREISYRDGIIAAVRFVRVSSEAGASPPPPHRTTRMRLTNNDLFSLTGRVAFITGASSGIGRVLAKGLARSGARIVAVARRADRLADLVQELADAGSEAIAVKADVTDAAGIELAFDEAERAFGVADVIVSNAGISAPGNFLKTGAESRDAVFDTNVRGVWNVGQAGARRLVAAGKGGSIINVASVLGLGAQPGLSSYCASKGAVIQLTRAMALDLVRHGIRVNALAPGWFRTELNDEYFESESGRDYVARMPAHRLGRIEELIGPAVMLASEAGSFVNGSVLVVDGALSAVVV